MDAPVTTAVEIVFYCKDCEMIVPTSKLPGKYVYKCKKCGTKNVAFGSKKSIFNFFHIEEEVVETKEEVAMGEGK